MKCAVKKDLQVEHRELCSTSSNALCGKQSVKEGSRYMYSQNLLKKLLKMVTGASLVAQLVKNLTAMEENPVRSLGREDPPPEK